MIDRVTAIERAEDAIRYLRRNTGPDVRTAYTLFDTMLGQLGIVITPKLRLRLTQQLKQHAASGLPGPDAAAELVDSVARIGKVQFDVTTKGNRKDPPQRKHGDPQPGNE